MRLGKRHPERVRPAEQCLPGKSAKQSQFWLALDLNAELTFRSRPKGQTLHRLHGLFMDSGALAMKTTVEVSGALYRRTKSEAALRGLSSRTSSRKVCVIGLVFFAPRIFLDYIALTAYPVTVITWVIAGRPSVLPASTAA